MQFYEMQIPAADFTRCALKIEQCRHFLIPETTLLLKLGGQEGLNKMGLVLFGKIFTDFTLKQFFKTNDFDVPVL